MKKANVEILPNEHFVDISPYYYGYEECAPSHSFGPARRTHFLFHYILSGKGKFLFTNDKGNEKEYDLQGGQGFLIWPEQQTFYIADEKNPWVYVWVSFDGLKTRELMLQAGLSYNNPIYNSKDSEEQEKMKNELLAIINNQNKPLLFVVGHLYLFLSALIASSSTEKKLTGGKLRDFYISECLNFIEQNYHKNISVEDIAGFCNLDRSYLGKVFKSVLNTSPHDFLIHYRVKKACELMKTTDYTIGQISEMLGYPNQFVFSRTFKNVIGHAPKNWRETNKYH